jgi:glycosyltransferase involved in cell wall biosynthesis
VTTLVAMPLVSICIPTYNGERYLDQCLASACSQTYANLEVLVVDDGSTDGTLALARQWAERDSRIRLEGNKTNLGLVGNINQCIDHARGEWVKFLFQDDFLDSRCVEVLLDHAGDKWKFLACDRNIIFNDVEANVRARWEGAEFNIHLAEERPGLLELSPRDVAALALDHNNLNFIGEPTVTLLHRSVFHMVGSFNADLVEYCDLEFWLRTGLSTGIRYVGDTLASFRVHSGSATAGNWQNSYLRTRYFDPLVLLHECLYSPFFTSWRQAAAERGRLRTTRAWFRKESLATHARVRLGALEDGEGPLSSRTARDWERLVARYPGLRSALDGLAPAAARAVHYKRARRRS